MSELQWITSHVERLLQDEWDVARVDRDGDGDFPFRAGTAACWVSVLDSRPVMVRVWGHAACGLKPTAKLLKELQTIEGQLLCASLVWTGGCVVVKQTISPIGLTAPVLAQALDTVGGVADDIGLLLAGMFGGTTPFPAQAETASEDVP